MWCTFISGVHLYPASKALLQELVQIKEPYLILTIDPATISSQQFSYMWALVGE